MKPVDGDFQDLAWHDCHIWGFELRPGDPEDRDWTSDLALHIDWIAEWVCGVDGGASFRVAPAVLVFHDVTELRVAIAWGDGRARTALHPASIDRIERQPVGERHAPDHPYYRWRILLNWPSGGQIDFSGSSFTQTLLAEPLLLEGRQQLKAAERRTLLGRQP